MKYFEILKDKQFFEQETYEEDSREDKRMKINSRIVAFLK
jgi:hypothetical protein